MFDRNRNYILQPLELKRHVNRKFRTLGVIQTSYEPENQWVLLFDREAQEFYQCKYTGKHFLKVTKVPDA